jgi:hypothetical protein
MTARWIGAVAALSFALGAAAAERLADHAAVAPLTPASSADGLQRVHLPFEVLQRSRAGLADLRVFNAAGESLPIARFVAPSQPAGRRAALPFFAWPQPARGGDAGALQVQVDAAGAVVRIGGRPVERKAGPAKLWLLDLSGRKANETLAALRFDWRAAANGQTAKAWVDGSDDLQSWHSVGHGTLLALASALPGAPPIAHKQLPLQGRWKYLRLRLDEPLPLSAIEAEWTAASTPVFDRARLRFDADSAAEPAWQLELQAALHLRRLRVELPQPNSVVMLQLEQRTNADAAWQPIGTHTVYRLVRGGEEITSPPIEIAAAPARHWRLTLPRRSPRLAAAALDAELAWPREELVFAARAPQPFTLAVGREGATDVALPLATLLPGYKSGDEQKLPLASLGPLVTQTPAPRGWAERLREAPPEERRRWLLWAVLGFAVLGLAWLARRLMKEMASPSS